MKNYILYNPISDNGSGAKVRNEIDAYIRTGKLIFMDVTGIKDINAFIDTIDISDNIIIAGGDGTLNHFINDCDHLLRDIYYYPCGNGNDFARDIKKRKGLIRINKYAKSLPTCTFNGETLKFFNGVSCGIDGYSCTECERIRRSTDKNVNYGVIAIKGIMKGYNPVNATITVDGEKREYTKVWACATMKGKYYGGGFMLAPEQNRLDEDNSLSLVVAHDASKFVITLALASVLIGKHTKWFKKYVDVIKCSDVKVEFDAPVSLQIDGEGYENITGYEATKENVLWNLKA